MKIRFAQYGIAHGHARGKAKVMKASDDVDFAGVYEPSSEIREALGSHEAYDGVHWFSSAGEMLEDESIAGIAAQGGCRITSTLHGRRWNTENTSGLTSRQAMIWRSSVRF